MTEEQPPSQRRESEIREKLLLTLMKEDFDAGFGKVVEDYWYELSRSAYRLLPGYAHLSDGAVQAGSLSIDSHI